MLVGESRILFGSLRLCRIVWVTTKKNVGELSFDKYFHYICYAL